MKLDADSLKKLLGDRLCVEVGVEERPDDTLMLRTHFRFPDGDNYPIHLSPAPSGGLRLSDRGHTLMHISYEHDVDSFVEGTRGMLLERIMDESGLQWDGGAFCFDTSPEQLPQAMFTFGQALTKVYDLTLLSRSSVASTFYDDLADLLFSLVDEAKVERDYEPEVPNSQAYRVDYRIESKGGVPLFFGVPNRDKARLATIMLSYFHRHELQSLLVFADQLRRRRVDMDLARRFESLLVFADQASVPRMDLARLSDVGGDMISSLASYESFSRKILQRVA